jgi:hypothetical protein
MSKFQGGLYPTIAISDTFNVIGHVLAAQIAYEKGNVIAATGTLIYYISIVDII